MVIVRDPLLDDLDAHQRVAVTSQHTPLAIIAPAGSGKTRVLTRRIAYRVREGADARHVLALTFTRKAAREIVDRLRALTGISSVTAGTFHATALAQLRRRAAERGAEPPRILDRKTRIIAPLIGGRGAAATVAVSEVAAEIEWAKSRLIAPDEYADAATAARRRLPRPADQLAELYARYESEKRKKRLLDFDDVLRRSTDAITTDGAFAAAQRWRFRHLFVDEFQDTTPLQLQLLRAWLGDRHDLTVVGDPAQAIYGFAGADAAPLLEFEHTFEGGITVALVQNFRSTPGIVAMAEAALGDSSLGARQTPHASRAVGDPPTIRAYPDDDLEARGVADACWREFAAGVPWHEMAVLFRTNAQSSRFEAAFTERGVPFNVARGDRFVTRPVVRALLDRLRDAERAGPGRGLAEHLADLAADDNELMYDDTRAHRDMLVEFGREFLAGEDGPGGVAMFVGWLDTATRGDPERRSGVDLLTFHRAKGLEWPVVYVTGLERGLVPISSAASDAARDEERRLLHVALSRAQARLQCSWARARTVGARRSAREPSPWLGDLERVAAAHAATPRDRKDHIAALRDTLAGATPPPARRQW